MGVGHILQLYPMAMCFTVWMQMDYALLHMVSETARECKTKTSQKPVGAAACAAVSRALFSANLCAVYAGPVGLSVFLLVPVCLGDRYFSIAGDRVPKTEDLN